MTVLERLVAGGMVVCVWLLAAIPSGRAGEPGRADRISESLAAWSGSPVAERVRGIERRFGLVLEHSGHWSGSEVRAFERGLAGLPEAFFDYVPTPMFVQRHGEACPFGQGTYRENCPAFDESGRTFYLYDTPPIAERWVEQVMPGLDDKQRHRLQYRRAAVHLVVAKLDDRLAWSETSQWREINGWYKDEPMNEARRGYSRPLGRRSAHLDLVTFAEEFFARPEQLLASPTGPLASRQFDHFDPDDSVVCRMFTRSRFLRHETRRLTRDWEPPERVNQARLDDSWNAAGTGCPSFEEWLDFEHLDGLEVLYASASSNQPESLFGHLMLHARYDSAANIFREGAQPVFQFGALTGPETGPVAYITKGVFGGFSSVLEFNTLRSVKRVYLRYDERNLRRYRLNLGGRQLVHAMQRVWEAERHIRYSYHFFRHNCASFLLTLLRPVFQDELARDPAPIVLPAHVLDTLAATDNGAEGPVLNTDYRRWSSSELRALRAIEKRRRRLADLQALPGVGSRQQARLANLHAGMESMGIEARQKAYEKFGRWAVAYLEGRSEGGDRETVQTIADFLYYGSVVERYFLEQARFARLEKALEVTETVAPPTARERLEIRREIYQYDSLRRRLKAWNDKMKAGVLRLADREGRIESPVLRRMREHEDRFHAVYRAVLDALSQVISTAGVDWSGTAYVGRKRRTRRQRLEERHERAVGRSGAARASIGGSAGLQTDAGSTPLAGSLGGRIDLSVAFLDDALGEVRLRGVRPEIEARVGDVELEVPAGPRWHRRLDLEMVILRYFDLGRQQGPLIDGLSDRLGWGLEVGAHHDGELGLKFGSRVSGGFLFPLVWGDSGVDHLVAGLFGSGRADLGRRRNATLLGARGMLRAQLHPYGSLGNLIRLDLQSHQYVRLGDGSWQFDLTGELSWRQSFRPRSARPLWLVPWLEAEYTSMQYLPQRTDRLDAQAGIRLEFPL